MQQKQLTPQQQQAYQKLAINPDNRVILSLDGGGVRGILTLQLLKKIEEVAGIPCYRFCDLIAGTSTGAIIAGLMCVGKTAAEIEDLYVQFIDKVFLKRGLLANRFLNPPAYDKINFRQALKSILADITLQEACSKTGLDLLITAKDVTDNEETYFTCFDVNGQLNGTYKDALLRVIMEATMSAPTYFHPLDRFIDGGTTTYNNPSLAAFLEAICYSGAGKYNTENITLFSFGTGKAVQSVLPDHALNPNGFDAYFWLNYVMEQSSQDASSTQVDTFRSGLMKADYRRFDISLDTESIKKIPDKDITRLHVVNANWMRDLTPHDMSAIQMDDVSKFGLLRVIGESMAEYIMAKNKFTADLNDTPTKRDELVTAFANIERIKALVSDRNWIDTKIVS